MIKKIFGAIAVVVVFVFLVLGIARTKETEEILSITQIQRSEGVPVVIHKVERGSVQSTRQYYGDVKPLEQSVVTAKLMDRIESILVQEGYNVRKDQPLVRFDTTASQANVIQARLAMADARKDYERGLALFEQGAISLQNLEKMKLNFDISSENYETSRRAVVLYAPVKGTVTRVDVQAGDLVNPGDVILILDEGKNLEVAFDISYEDRPMIVKGLPVLVKSGLGEEISGVITRIGLATEKESRMFKAYSRIPVTEFIYPGIMVEAEVTLKSHDNVLVVPFDSILNRKGEKMVVLVNGSKAVLRPVKVGLQSVRYVEILSGVNEGDMLAVHGHDDLMDGDKIVAVAR